MAREPSSALHDQLKSPWGFAQLLERIDIGILVLDLRQQQIDYCNAAIFEVLRDDQLCHSFQQLYDLFVRDIDAGQEAESAAHSAHQMTYRGRLYGFTVYNAAPSYRCILVRDITEKIRLESIAQAINAMDNIGFIFSGIRHEIGNPLNSLKMALSVLKQNIDQATPAMLKEYLERGLADIGRIEYLLKSLKTFSLYEEVEIRTMSLIEFMEKFIALIERDLNSNGIRIRTEIPLSIGQVRIDERALHQALLNIFNNAADALQGRQKPEIFIHARIHGDLVWLTIADNGCGIGDQQKKHLFQPFNTSKPNGNGLGLVITKKLLAMMNGDIAIASRTGEGTQVTVSLPVAERPPEALAASTFSRSAMNANIG